MVIKALRGDVVEYPSSVLSCATTWGIGDLDRFLYRFSFEGQGLTRVASLREEPQETTRTPVYGPGFAGTSHYLNAPPQQAQGKAETFLNLAALMADTDDDPASAWLTLLLSAPDSADLAGWSREPYRVDFRGDGVAFPMYAFLFATALALVQKDPARGDRLHQLLREHDEQLTERLTANRSTSVAGGDTAFLQNLDPLNRAYQWTTTGEAPIHMGILTWLLRKFSPSERLALDPAPIRTLLPEIESDFPEEVTQWREILARRAEKRRSRDSTQANEALIASRYRSLLNEDPVAGFLAWLAREEAPATDKTHIRRLRNRSERLMHAALRAAATQEELPAEIMHFLSELHPDSGADANNGVIEYLRRAPDPETFLRWLDERPAFVNGHHRDSEFPAFGRTSVLRAYHAWYRTYVASGRRSVVATPGLPPLPPNTQVFATIGPGEFRYRELEELLSGLTQFLTWPLPPGIEPGKEPSSTMTLRRQRPEPPRFFLHNSEILRTITEQSRAKATEGWSIGEEYHFDDLPASFESDLDGAQVAIVRRGDGWALQLSTMENDWPREIRATPSERYSWYTRTPQAQRPGQPLRLRYAVHPSSVGARAPASSHGPAEDTPLGASQITVESDPIADHLAGVFSCDPGEMRAAVAAIFTPGYDGATLTVAGAEASVALRCETPSRQAERVHVDALGQIERLRLPALVVEAQVSGDMERWYATLLTLAQRAAERAGGASANGYLAPGVAPAPSAPTAAALALTHGANAATPVRRKPA
jgi:hypothetical protein